MITKTQLDISLRQLEERLRRKIDTKNEATLREIKSEIKNLKESVGLLEEKNEENRDIIKNHIAKQNNVKQKIEEVKPNKDKNDIITSDF